MVDFVPSLPARLDSESMKRRADEIKLLEDRVDEVERKIDQLELRKLEIINQINDFGRPDDRDYQFVKTPSKIHIVAFVDKIEEALLYFKLKEFVNKCDIIKYDTFPTRDFLNNVFRKQPGMEEFAKLEYIHLINAVLVSRHTYTLLSPILTVRITQLTNECLPKFREEYINNKKSMWLPWEKKTEFTESEKQVLERRFPESPPKVVDEYIVLNYFANLVNKVREGYYVMSEDPAVEVSELLKRDPLVYQDSKLVCDTAGFMTAYAGQEAPAMGGDVDEMFTKAIDKYKGFVEMFKARGMTDKT